MTKVHWKTGLLQSDGQVRESIKRLGQLEGMFLDEDVRRSMDQDMVVYRVQAWCPIPEGTEGGQFWGSTVIEPGQVGNEYFMTHGHFHLKRDRTEFYGTVEGRGALILMSEDRKTRMEEMSPGSLHFIPPNTAHRVANTGKVPLSFVACWPSDAGHDYDSIRKFGFGARLININDKPALVRK
jgi:glucose-6-phosphate isomerase, archaeal